MKSKLSILLWSLILASSVVSAQGLKALLANASGCPKFTKESVRRQIMKDPWGSDFVYVSDGKTYSIKSLGQDKKEGGVDADRGITSQQP